ncbi:MAG: FAD-dependent oxidoreductase [Chloroflexi bacterium]|nr:FAD-dependent oxidoreductase [Chloroflexota bacterium]
MKQELAANLECDVLVIGAGIAGLTAAIDAAEAGAKVTVLSKGPIASDGAASWMAGWGFQTALYPPDSPEEHARNTIQVGQYLNNQELVLALTNETQRCLHRLARWGLHYRKVGDRYFQVRLPGSTHPRVPRLSREGLANGIEYRRVYPRQLRKLGVRALGNLQAIELLKRNGAVMGVIALDTVNGAFVAIRAKAVVLSTGGFMGMYRFTSTSPTLTGEGHGMAYQAGAQFQDIEFADFYTGCIVWPPFFAGDLDWVTSLRYDLAGVVYNSRGEDVARYKKGSGLALPVIFEKEIRAGRCSPHGGLYLSFKHLPDNLIDHYFSSMGRARWIHALEEIGVDIRRGALEIRPAPLESIGGCRVDARARTNVPGLLAAGEITGGAEGAFTLAGNPMSFYMAMGAIAGRQAAVVAKEVGAIPDDLPDVRPMMEDAVRPLENEGKNGVPVLQVKRELQEILHNYLHLMGKTQTGLDVALQRILSIRDDAEKWQVATKSRRHNNEWMEALEVRHMVTVCEMMARAALARTESRGLHYREDYPAPSNDWLCNLIIERDGDEMKISRAPVSFSFVEPGQR